LEVSLNDIRRAIDHEEAGASKAEQQRKSAQRDFEDAQGRPMMKTSPSPMLKD